MGKEVVVSGMCRVVGKRLSEAEFEFWFFAFLASHFFFCSENEVTKKMPLRHPCPIKSMGFPKIVRGHWLVS